MQSLHLRWILDIEKFQRTAMTASDERSAHSTIQHHNLAWQQLSKIHIYSLIISTSKSLFQRLPVRNIRLPALS